MARGTLIVLAAIATSTIVSLSLADAQPCRRACRAGEKRDIRGCCIPAPKAPARAPAGSLRIEADVRRATVTVAGIRRSLRLPATLRGVRVGKHAIELRRGKSVWRSTVVVTKKNVTRVFASVRGGEWAQTRAQQKRARKLLSRALAAKGGAKVRAMRSMRFTGRSAANSSVWPNAWQTHIWARGRRQRWEFASKGWQVVAGLTPTANWDATYKGPRVEQSRSRPPEPWVLARTWWHPERVLLRHRTPTARVALLPPAVLNRVTVDVVQVASGDGAYRARLFIDRRTKMVVKIQPILADGKFDRSVELSDYRKVDGVAVAFRWVYQGMDVQWASVQLNVAVDAKLFVAPKAMPTEAPVATYQHSRYWRGPPYLVDVNGDGAEELVGVHEDVILKSGRTSRTTYVTAMDGKTFTPLWRRKIARYSHVHVGSRRVAIAEPKAEKIELVDLRKGKRVRSIRLSDRVSRLCANPAAPDQLWVKVADNNSRLFDLATGRTTPMAKSDWCPRSLCRRAGQRCVSTRLSSVLGRKLSMYRSHAMSVPMGRIIMGVRTPGTGYPIAARLDATDNVLWRHRLGVDPSTGAAAVGLLAGGQLYYVYDDDHGGSRIGVLRLRDGRTRWDIPLPGKRRLEHVRVTPKRVYAVSSNHLYVFDAKTGKQLQSIGHRSRKVKVTQPPP